MKKLILFNTEALLDSHSKKYSISDARDDIIEELQPKDTEKFLKIFDNNSFWTKSGMKLNFLIAMYLKISGCNCSVEKFKKIYLKYMKKIPWNKKMIKLLKILSNKHCKIGLISNLCEIDLELLKENLSLEQVDYCFFSFSLEKKMSEIEIYDMVTIISGCDKNQILFVDDNQLNIREAQTHKWNTILATSNNFDKIQKKCFSFLSQKTL